MISRYIPAIRQKSKLITFCTFCRVLYGILRKLFWICRLSLLFAISKRRTMFFQGWVAVQGIVNVVRVLANCEIGHVMSNCICLQMVTVQPTPYSWSLVCAFSAHKLILALIELVLQTVKALIRLHRRNITHFLSMVKIRVLSHL